MWIWCNETRKMQKSGSKSQTIDLLLNLPSMQFFDKRKVEWYFDKLEIRKNGRLSDILIKVKNVFWSSKCEFDETKLGECRNQVLNLKLSICCQIYHQCNFSTDGKLTDILINWNLRKNGKLIEIWILIFYTWIWWNGTRKVQKSGFKSQTIDLLSNLPSMHFF